MLEGGRVEKLFRKNLFEQHLSFQGSSRIGATRFQQDDSELSEKTLCVGRGAIPQPKSRARVALHAGLPDRLFKPAARLSHYPLLG